MKREIKYKMLDRINDHKGDGSYFNMQGEANSLSKNKRTNRNGISSRFILQGERSKFREKYWTSRNDWLVNDSLQNRKTVFSKISEK